MQFDSAVYTFYWNCVLDNFRQADISVPNRIGERIGDLAFIEVFRASRMSFSHPHRRRLERFVRRTLLYKHLIRMRVLAISGSLRSKSTNTVLLRALAELAPPEIEIVLFQELDRIPPFNPDLEAENGTGPVARFRAALRETGAVIFSTPEYAHGLPGVLKNALDWVVGSGELSRKLVVLVNASSRGTYAQASLKEILKTMDATVLHDAEVTINLLGKNLTPAEIARDPTFASSLVISLQSLLTLAFMARPDKSVRLDDGQS